MGKTADSGTWKEANVEKQAGLLRIGLCLGPRAESTSILFYKLRIIISQGPSSSAILIDVLSTARTRCCWGGLTWYSNSAADYEISALELWIESFRIASSG